MELVDSGHYYIYENGNLRDSHQKKKSRFLGCHRRSASSLAVDNYLIFDKDTQIESNCQTPQGIASLFDICIEFIARNIASVDSLVDFPDTVGKRIFESVVKNGILLSASDDDCKKVLQTFDKAYGQVLMEELHIGSCAILESHLGSFCSFNYLSKLDISGCQIGDMHDVLGFAGQLARLTHLSLQDNCISDDGLRRFTAPLRMYGCGPSKLQLLDLSDNSRITNGCSRYIKCFSFIKVVRLTGTGVSFSEAEQMCSMLPWLLRGEDNVNFGGIFNKGWAAPIIERWIVEAELRNQEKSRVVCGELLPSTSFYHQPKRLIKSIQLQRPREVVVLVSPNPTTVTSVNSRCVHSSKHIDVQLRGTPVVGWKTDGSQFSGRKNVCESEELETNLFETCSNKSSQPSADDQTTNNDILERKLCDDRKARVLCEKRMNKKDVSIIDGSLREIKKAKSSSLIKALNASRW